MHVDVARESLQYRREQSQKFGWDKTPELTFLQDFVTEPEFLALAKRVGSEKTKSIIETIEKNSDNKYARVTSKQRYAIAADLLSNLSADVVIESAFNKS